MYNYILIMTLRGKGGRCRGINPEDFTHVCKQNALQEWQGGAG